MRLFRLLVVLLIAIALPFSNAAAAAMMHCVSPVKAAQAMAIVDAHDSTLHAHHHAMQDNNAEKHHQHSQTDKSNDSNKSQSTCAECAFCHFCVAAILPPYATPLSHIAFSVVKKKLVIDHVPPPLPEQLYRPPQFAFA